MIFKYSGIDKRGNYKRGTVTADNNIDALSTIREDRNIVLIINLSKQNQNKFVQKILSVTDKQAELFGSIFMGTRTIRGQIEKLSTNFSNLFKADNPMISRFREGLENTNIPFLKRNERVNDGELINVFNSESFSNLHLQNQQERVIEKEVPQVSRIVVASDSGAEKSINWDLLTQRREVSSRGKNKKLKIRKKDILLFTKRLQIMLASGMTLLSALRVLSKDGEKRGLPILVNEVIRSLQSGNTLSESLALFPKQFDYLYISLVSIGESSGNIHEVLLDIIEAREQDEKISKKLKTAMIYPVIMGIVLTLILILGSVFFIPTFEDMFSEQGMSVPKITSVVFSFAAIMPYIIVGIIVAVISFNILRRFSKGINNKYISFRDMLALRLPVLKNINSQSYMHSFSFTVALMVKNGIRLKDALEMSHKTIDNIHIKNEIQQVSQLMVEGLTMSEALFKQKYFEDIVTNVALTGEESGQMGFALEQISIYYKNELEKSIDVAMELVEPLSIILIAAIVVPVILAIYLPILDISSGATLGL